MKNILLGLALVSTAFPAFANPVDLRSFMPAVPDYVDDGGIPLSEQEALSLMDDGLAFTPEEPAPQPEQPAPEQPAPAPQPEEPAPQPEQPAPPPTERPAPMPHPDHRRPLPRPGRGRPLPLPVRGWVCVAVDRAGHRFVGRSFIPGQARRAALSSCHRGVLRPFRGCRIVSCYRR